MSSGRSSEVKLEIGHVLFIDIVGYSQLLITQQSEQVETLRRIVRGTAQFRAAAAEGNLIRLPTGDGGGLVFRTTPEAPVLYALALGICAVLAGWTKPRWLQWVGVGGLFVQNIAYFVLFTAGS